MINGKTELVTTRGQFVKDVLSRIQEYISDKYNSPSILYVFSGNKTFPYFPENRYLHFCGFCDKFRRYTGVSAVFSKCVVENSNFIAREAKSNVGPVSRKWINCFMGLQNLFVPIYSKSSKDLVAALLVGQFTDDAPGALSEIHDNIANLYDTPEIFEEYCFRNNVSVRELVDDLLKEAMLIPRISKEMKVQYLAEIGNIVDVFEYIAVEALQRGSLFDRDRLIEKLNLSSPSEQLDENQISEKLGYASKKLIENLDFESFSIYKSTFEGYGKLIRIRSAEVEKSVGEVIGFDTYSDFNNFRKHEGVIFPSLDKCLYWLNPMVYFNRDSALVFSIETYGGEFFLIGFGFSSANTPSELQMETIRYAVRKVMLHFLDYAYFAVTLDHLTQETGHMLGRTSAKIEVGVDAFNKLFSHNDLKEGDKEYYEHHKWTLQDGIWNLRLIENNYHNFKESRLGRKVNHKTQVESYDLVSVINRMTEMFVRMAHENERIIRAEINVDKYLVVGNKLNMELVLLNLVDNAIKYGYRNTYITMQAFIKSEEMCIAIENLGTGVSPDEQISVFTAFTQSRLRSEHTHATGIGLGLSFCKRIIENEYSGNIVLRSQKQHSKKERPKSANWLTRVIVTIPKIAKPERTNNE
jgi:Histidine kinase-, DNA gyrase B-, and HSP90-like ATPase